MKNNKGFTLVELLAVITIVAIISVLGIYGYTAYIGYTKGKAYDTLAKSAANAAAEYRMDYPDTDTVTLETLTEEQYLEYPTDPSSKGTACTGKVDITLIPSEDDGLDEEEYEVTICCINYSYKYNFPIGSKEKSENSCPIE